MNTSRTHPKTALSTSCLLSSMASWSPTIYQVIVMTIFVSKLFMIYNISAFDSKAPAKSVAAVLNKAIKLFSTIKFDVAPYVENSYATVTEVK